ncbi:cupin domain-containing protein [Thaumasiovibrio subtropicus]|uniref:cupin domain-containing protein n=1 Tax=Thaumasiovibrio subtropicus TaxID=1891207 RepID=UPI000B35B3C2|nr:cupin domain-containing protein [Thaumasiovibrio subtropicus]
MSTILPQAAKEKYGIESHFEQMENGEKRFRLVADNRSAYVMTCSSDKGAWQNSHFHHTLREIYIVQTGWIAVAIREQHRMTMRTYGEGEVITIEPGVIHNVYLSANVLIHTIKYGQGSMKDWVADAKLDSLSKGLDELDIHSLTFIP